MNERCEEDMQKRLVERIEGQRKKLRRTVWKKETRRK
jgi:hypothetical protein